MFFFLIQTMIKNNKSGSGKHYQQSLLTSVLLTKEKLLNEYLHDPDVQRDLLNSKKKKKCLWHDVNTASDVSKQVSHLDCLAARILHQTRMGQYSSNKIPATGLLTSKMLPIKVKMSNYFP